MNTRTRLPGQRTSPPTPRRGVAVEVARGVVAAVALAVFVVGVPLALAFLTSRLPIHLPDTGIVDMLTRRDDGSLLLVVLIGIGWLAWAVFAVSVFVEAAAAVRGLPVPRLPGLGLGQWAAGALVAATAVLATPVPSFASPAPSATPATRSDAEPATSGSAAAVPARDFATPRVATPHQAHVAHMAHVAHQARTGGLPTVIVGRYDTLWGLADRHLGDGTRYREIFELNRGLAQNDGATLRDPDVVHPGWLLRLPADARDLPTRQATRATAAASGPAAVSTRAAGSPATQHVEEPEQTAPATPAAEAEPTVGPTPVHEPAEPTPAGDAPAATSTPTAAPQARASSPTPSTYVTPTPVETPTATSNAPTPAFAAESVSERGSDDREPGGPATMLVAGLTAMTLTGMVGELARRRRRQRARRRIGERVPMPAGEDASFEAVAASVSAPVTVDVLRRALRHVAAACVQRDRLLPDLRLLLVGPDTLDLHLGTPEDTGLGPFTPTGPDRWQLDSSSPLLRRDAGYGADPYPNLVALGAIGDRQALLNLDSVGALHLAGDPDCVADAQRAIAVDLAIGPLSGWAFPVFADCFHDLAAVLDPTRVTVETDPTVVTSTIAHRLRDSDGGDRPSLRLDADPTYVALAVVPLGPEPDPYCGAAVVDTSADGTGGACLSLAADGSAVLTPDGLALDPQRLSRNDYERVVSLLDVGLRDPVTPVGARRDAADDTDDYAAAHGAIPATDDQAVAHAVPAIDVVSETRDSAPDVAADLAPATKEPIRVGAPTVPDGTAEVVEAPRVLLLGQVDVERCAGAGSPESRRRTTELVAFLALNPASTGLAIDEVLWPGQRVDRRTRNTTVTRARIRLGKRSDGTAYLPVLDGPDARYGLHPDVTCDWRDFEVLARRGTAAGPAGLDDLDAALGLVRGRPFLGIDPGRYVWAETVITRMIDTVVDVAALAADTHLANGDPRKSLRAALIGLTVDDSSDVLYDVAEKAARTARDSEALTRIHARRARADDLDEW